MRGFAGRIDLGTARSTLPLRGCSFPCGRVQNALAQAKRLRRRFHVLIYVDVLDRTLQGHPERRFELNPFAFALAAHVGQVLFLAWIDWQLFRARIFAQICIGSVTT